MDQGLFQKAVGMVEEVVAKVKQEDLAHPTPCSEWNVHELLNHLISEVAWVEPLLQGKTISEVGDILNGDLVGTDALTSWQTYAESAMNAAHNTPGDNMAHLSYADKPVSEYLVEIGADMMIHGWDLAQAIGAPYTIDEQSAQIIIDGSKDVIPMMQGAGMVGPAIEIPDDATAEDRLLGQFGRTKNWAK